MHNIESKEDKGSQQKTSFKCFALFFRMSRKKSTTTTFFYQKLSQLGRKLGLWGTLSSNPKKSSAMKQKIETIVKRKTVYCGQQCIEKYRAVEHRPTNKMHQNKRCYVIHSTQDRAN